MFDGEDCDDAEHVYNYQTELIRQVDLRREWLIAKVHDWSAELIGDLESRRHLSILPKEKDDGYDIITDVIF